MIGLSDSIQFERSEQHDHTETSGGECHRVVVRHRGAGAVRAHHACAERHTAAGRHAQLQDLVAGLLGALGLLGIVGVVEDYHHEAIKKEIYPTIFFLNHNIGQQVYYSVRLNTKANTREVVEYIEESWKEIFPEKQFEYFFLSDYYDQQFKSELHFSRVFALFSVIAIFIACLGILGMTLFESNARLKEISIRKVLGASAANVVALLSKDNIRYIALSAVLAIPVIYFTAMEWLSTYPVRIQLSLVFFLVPVVVILSLVMATASFQTIRAATSNPVDHLKHE